MNSDCPLAIAGDLVPHGEPCSGCGGECQEVRLPPEHPCFPRALGRRHVHAGVDTLVGHVIAPALSRGIGGLGVQWQASRLIGGT